MSTSYEVKWPDYAAPVVAVAFITAIGLSGDLLFGAMYVWPLAILDAALIGVGAWKYRNRWLFLLLPVILLPFVPILFVLHSCLRGDCL